MARALLAFDGSSGAAAAAEASAALLPGGEAIVLHVRGVPPADAETLEEVRAGHSMDEAVQARDEREAAESEAVAERGAELARAAGWTAEARSTLAYGGIWDEVLRVAGEEDVDVIVLGARGMTGVRAALGSVSDAVVHNAHQPVLVVPEPSTAPEGGAGPVLVAHDGSDGARAALDAALRLVGGRELLICHAGAEDGDPAVAEALAHAEANGARARSVQAPSAGLARRAWHGLLDAAAEHQAAAIVIGSRGRSPLTELALGSVAMGVLHHAERPVILVRPAG